MNIEQIRHELLRVFLPATVLGALGAPVVFVGMAYLAPTGFMDLREASVSTVSSALLSAWAFSLVLTLPTGAALWHALHVRRLDGFTTYGLIGLTAAALVSLLIAQRLPSGHFAAMVLANAVLVRLVELSLRVITRRGYLAAER